MVLPRVMENYAGVNQLKGMNKGQPSEMGVSFARFHGAQCDTKGLNPLLQQ